MTTPYRVSTVATSDALDAARKRHEAKEAERRRIGGYAFVSREIEQAHDDLGVCLSRIAELETTLANELSVHQSTLASFEAAEAAWRGRVGEHLARGFRLRDKCVAAEVALATADAAIDRLENERAARDETVKDALENWRVRLDAERARATAAESALAAMRTDCEEHVDRSFLTRAERQRDEARGTIASVALAFGMPDAEMRATIRSALGLSATADVAAGGDRHADVATDAEIDTRFKTSRSEAFAAMAEDSATKPVDATGPAPLYAEDDTVAPELDAFIAGVADGSIACKPATSREPLGWRCPNCDAADLFVTVADGRVCCKCTRTSKESAWVPRWEPTPLREAAKAQLTAEENAAVERMRERCIGPASRVDVAADARIVLVALDRLVRGGGSDG